jgi:hypothetical protein
MEKAGGNLMSEREDNFVNNKQVGKRTFTEEEKQNERQDLPLISSILQVKVRLSM